MNWRADRLTATRMGAGPWSRHLHAWAARLEQHPARDLANQAGVLGQRDERVREHQAAFGVLPAHQRLDPGQRAGADGDLRLVEQQQLVAVDGPAKARTEDHPVRRRTGAHLGDERDAVAAGFLAAIHRDVRVLEQGRRVLAVVGKHRDPDARAEPALLPVHHERLGQRFQEAKAELVDVDLVGDVLGEHDEFVAAEPGDRVGVPNRLAEPPRHHFQDFIAGVVSEGVVDVLEPVEVDEQQGEGTIVAARDRDRMIQPLEELGSIVETRQRIEAREPADFRLDQLLLRDVEPDAAVSDEGSVLGEYGFAADRNIADAAVLPRLAQDDFVKRLVRDRHRRSASHPPSGGTTSGSAQGVWPRCFSIIAPTGSSIFPLMAVKRKSASWSQCQSDPSSVRLWKRASLADSAAIRFRRIDSGVLLGCAARSGRGISSGRWSCDGGDR